MIISGYEKPVEYGRQQIFDPTMAAMVLRAQENYNAALKDEYERGLKDLDNFYTNYGDFMSPFSKDMDRYGEMVGKIRGALDDAYAKGINLLQSSEGRMLIRRLTNSIDPAEFNNMKTNAKLGFEYLKNIEEAKDKDQFSQEFEDYLLTHGGPGLFKDFSSKNGATWNRPGPGRYQTIDDLIEPIVKNVDYTFDEAMTKQHNDGNNYYSITRDRLAKAIDDNMSDILATQSGGFHYWKAMEAAKALGGDEEMGKKIFRDMISNRLSDHEKVKFEADPFRLDDYRTKNDIRAHRAKAAIDYDYKHKDDQDPTNTEDGYSLLKDVYVTTLANGAGRAYLSQGGVGVNELPQLLKEAERRQKTAINSGVDVLTATGQFISPDKINGVIPSTKADGNGQFLNPNFIHTLRTEEFIENSFGRDSGFGFSTQWDSKNSAALRKKELKKSEDITSALEKVNGEKGYYVKVVPMPNKNHHNIYSMVGDDRKWHTYSRVKVYLSNGRDTRNVDLGNGFTMPKTGIDLVLPIGLQSNEGKASPDLSINARERVGIKPYNTVKGWVGKDQDADFPWGTNLIKNTTSL